MTVYPLSLRILRGWAPPHRPQALAIALGILLELAGSPSPFPAGPGAVCPILGQTFAAVGENSEKIITATEGQAARELAPDHRAPARVFCRPRSCSSESLMTGCACRLGGSGWRTISSYSDLAEEDLVYLQGFSRASSGPITAPFVWKKEGGL